MLIYMKRLCDNYSVADWVEDLEARTGIEPMSTVLQTAA